MRKLDFALLESVIFEPKNLSGFYSEIRRPRSEVATVACELFLEGYLSARIFCDSQRRINDNSRRAYRRHRHLLKRSRNVLDVAAPSLKDICMSLDDYFTIVYFLTPAGGQYLEQELSMNWDLFYQEKTSIFSIPTRWKNLIVRENKADFVEGNTSIIYSQNKEILESLISRQASTILLGSLKWHVLKNQKILYWKQPSNIHVVSFLYKTQDRTYFKDALWYTVPVFEPHPPSDLLPEYFEYYSSADLGTSEWHIEYIILKIGITYMEKYNSPRYLWWENYSGDMTQSKVLISGANLFERGFIEANILDWQHPYTASKDEVATKVFLNKRGIESALNFQLMATYYVTELGYKHCQFLEKTHKYLPEVSKFAPCG
jgi:hypothetical protein